MIRQTTTQLSTCPFPPFSAELHVSVQSVYEYCVLCEIGRLQNYENEMYIYDKDYYYDQKVKL